MKTQVTGLNQDVVDQFILEVSLVRPIEKIIGKLMSGDFRDCDIAWLDKKLEDFTVFACKTLGFEAHIPAPEKGRILNDYTKKQYVDRFSTLLNYFKGIISEDNKAVS